MFIKLLIQCTGTICHIELVILIVVNLKLSISEITLFCNTNFINTNNESKLQNKLILHNIKTNVNKHDILLLFLIIYTTFITLHFSNKFITCLNMEI